VRADERARVARAGAVLVHCPGTHAFFGREPFPWRAWREAGVDVALGTDSLASNDSLDLRLALGRLRAAHPLAPAAAVLDAATLHGARALGLEGEVGAVTPGARADLLATQAPESDASRLAERLARGEFDVHRIWLRGEEVAPPRSRELPEAPSSGRGAFP
jgi:cytosine/adenosine deaminase-related metal-dependent hydrolase